MRQPKPALGQFSGRALGHVSPREGGWSSAVRTYATRHWVLWALLALALVLRVAWILGEVPILQGDECEYLRMADSLLRSHRYAGLYDGLQLVYPPLLPLLIVLFSPLAPSLPAAGVAVSLVSGLMLVAATYALAHRLYGERAGILAAALATVHPTLVQLSGTILSEAVYLPLIVAGTYAGVRWLDERMPRWGALCGLSFGLAYLTRPEALIAPVAIAAAFVLTARAHRVALPRALLQVMPLLAATALVAAPYVAYLTVETGKFRLEGKSVVNFTMAQRINAGMDVNEAAIGLGPDLQEDGPLLSVNRWVLEAPAAIPAGGLADYWVHNAARNAGPLRWTLLSSDFGGYLVLLLAAVGAFVRPRRQLSLARESLVLALVAGYAGILLGMSVVLFRYVVPLLPFLLVWSANGIGLVADRMVHASRFALPRQHALQTLSATVVPAALVLALVVQGADLGHGGDFRSAAPMETFRKEAGLWVAGATPPARHVMSTSNEVPYYSRATATRLPYASSARALGYIHRLAPDYIVLTREPSTVGDYYPVWLSKGIPDAEARLVHVIGNPADPDVAIYRWVPDRQSGAIAERRPALATVSAARGGKRSR